MADYNYPERPGGENRTARRAAAKRTDQGLWSKRRRSSTPSNERDAETEREASGAYQHDRQRGIEAREQMLQVMHEAEIAAVTRMCQGCARHEYGR
jgi:hypothetical protein